MPEVAPDAYNTVLDPAEVAAPLGRQQIFLNAEGNAIRIARPGISWDDATVAAYLADTDVGSIPVDFRIVNRNVSIPLFLGASGDRAAFDAARRQLQQKVGLILREGGFIKRSTPWAAMYADVVSATLTEPDATGETGAIEDSVVLQLQCLPDFYGDQIDLDELTCTMDCTALLELDSEQATVTGTMPGRLHVVIADTSGHDQHGLIWGLRAQHYDPSPTAALSYEAQALSPASGSMLVPLAGASGGQAMKSPTLSSMWTSVIQTQVIGSGPMTHLGAYRIWCRVYGTGAAQLQFFWQVGTLAAPVSNSPVTVPGSGDFFLLDLGEISLSRLPVGTGAWQGLVQAMGSGNVYVDKLYLQPLDEAAGQVSAYSTSLAVGQVAPAVIYSNQQCQVGYDGVYGLASDGSAWAEIQPVIGDYPRLPPSGVEQRPVQLFLKPTRGDLASQPDHGIDAFTVQPSYRPVYLFRP